METIVIKGNLKAPGTFMQAFRKGLKKKRERACAVSDTEIIGALEPYCNMSRLQCAVHGIYAWGAHCPPNVIFIVHLTRVQDKGSDFTAMVMEHALDYLQSRGILGSKPGPRGGWPAPT
jgi:hypothetical protein